MTTISSTTILRSRNTARPDKVLSTLLLRYPDWIHAEQRTHRQIPLDEGLSFEWPTPSVMADPNLSRNANSLRAIPTKKLIQDVIDDPAIPLFWGRNEPGMQAWEELTGAELEEAKAAWTDAYVGAIYYAQRLAAAGAHKQIVNRVLAPYTHKTVVVSATEWTNFLAVRNHPDAEPHIRMLAEEVAKCLNDESTVQTLRPNEWHLPFGEPGYVNGPDIRDHIAVSVARNASTSYKTVDGFDMTFDRAIALHDKLVGSRPMHASPAEHVAQADDCHLDERPFPGAIEDDTWGYVHWDHPEQHGNFVGFRQYRKMLPGECL